MVLVISALCDLYVICDAEEAEGNILSSYQMLPRGLKDDQRQLNQHDYHKVKHNLKNKTEFDNCTSKCSYLNR